MKTAGHLTLTLIALTTMMLSTSCRHKYLYMEEDMTSRLEVVFDWRNAPEANPSSMAMYLYDSEGRQPLRYIFDNRYGGEIKAPLGTHHAICMNADNTYWVRMRNNEKIETMEIYTPDASSLGGQSLAPETLPRAEGSDGERMAETPGMLWGSRENNIEIVPHEGTQKIILYPSEAICYYTVDVLDVENLEGVASSTIDATISGMAEGYSFGAEAATEVPVTMNFSLRTVADSDTSLHGEFLTFGECTGRTEKHYLTVYLVLSDGSRWWHSFDVSEQVADAPDPKHVHIVVRGLPLPEPPSEGGTQIAPYVNEWQPVEINLKM
ncbi:MAG: DUF5119 domain-containing protein [Muribaculaceae bacterium]|nr:DUF5119 domain-containing protein [Muribaculaceae bacterium]